MSHFGHTERLTDKQTHCNVQEFWYHPFSPAPHELNQVYLLIRLQVDDCNEVTDYAIARCIVDLHTRMEESVQRVYEPEDVARYIMFARSFKPKLSEEAMEFLVEQYRSLRQRDTGGGAAKSSWRITVRQIVIGGAVVIGELSSLNGKIFPLKFVLT